jgi:hypothetical protein
MPNVECRVGKVSDDGHGEVRNESCGCKFRPRRANPADKTIHTEHRHKGGSKRDWNEIEALLMEVEEGIEEHSL